MISNYAEIIQDLRVFPCLSALFEEDLSVIGPMAEHKSLSKGDILFSESEPLKFLYIVRTGSIKLYKTSAEGRELTMKIMGPGDYFCCAPMYMSGRYFVSATAVRASEIITIPAAFFKELLMNEVSEKGMRIISGLCNRISYLSNLVGEITFKDVEQRVIITLLRLAENCTSNGNIVYLQLPHHDIASMTGTVREVVSRTMSRLKKDGVIVDSSVKGFKIDKERLKRCLNGKYPSV
jgi:CRP/FNR family transcriptional regulator